MSSGAQLDLEPIRYTPAFLGRLTLCGRHWVGRCGFTFRNGHHLPVRRHQWVLLV